MRTLVVVLLLLVAAPAVRGADEGGDRTITKVIKLLQEMLEKSKADGERDTELYAKYKCYCDSNTASKTKSIAELDKSIKILTGEIEELSASNGALSTENAQLSMDISENERATETATQLRDKANADFKEQETDMTSAIDQMDQAIDTLSAIGADQTAKAGLIAEKKFMSKEGVLKSSVADTLKGAALFLPQKQQKAVAAFIQAPFTGTYQAQSGEIVGILKNMRDTFKANLATAQAAEKSGADSDTEFQGVKAEELASMKAAFEDKEKLLADNDGNLATKKTTKEESEASKAADEDFLAKLTTLCSKKAKEYDERNTIRAGEEAAIAQATAILNSDTAFDTFGGTKAATGFLQMRLRTQRKSARELVVDRLKHDAKKHKSLRLAKVAAMLETGNPLDKVCFEVERMEELIAKEGKADADQLAWCNSERESNNDQRETKEDMIDELNTKKTELLDIIDNEETGLKKMVADEEATLATNQKDQADLIEERAAANAAYQKNVHNLVEAEKILTKATAVLKKFYDFLKAKLGPHHYDKTAGKDSGGSNIKRIPEASIEDLETACSEDPSCAGFNSDGWLKSAIQDESKFIDTKGDLYIKVYEESLLQRKSREDPAPPQTFEDEEEFGQTSAGGDAIGMLNTILKDTEEEEKAAHDSERSAQGAFEDAMTNLKEEEATSQTTLADLNEQLSEKEKSLAETNEDLEKTTKEHTAIVDYLLKIKPGCDFITENIETRNEHRKAEMDSLINAEATLKATPVYKKAAAEAEKEALGECLPKCPIGEDKNLACKACLAGITESAYCGGHAEDPVCAK